MPKRYAQDTRIDPDTSKKFGEFLTNVPQGDPDLESYIKQSDILMASSIIRGPKEAKMLAYYKIMHKTRKSIVSMFIHDVLSAESISFEGTGREQLTSILRGFLPREDSLKMGEV